MGMFLRSPSARVLLGLSGAGTCAALGSALQTNSDAQVRAHPAAAVEWGLKFS